jgi:hypothetical protein
MRSHAHERPPVPRLEIEKSRLPLVGPPAPPTLSLARSGLTVRSSVTAVDCLKRLWTDAALGQR